MFPIPNREAHQLLVVVKMDLAEDVDDSVEEENILYFPTTHTEWSLEPEVAVSPINPVTMY